MTTTLPANVTIVDLPSYTTLSGSELFEAVQTQGGVALSVQVPLSAMMTAGLGGLPTGGVTGQFLMKSSATDFASQWSAVNLASSASVTGILQPLNGGWGASSFVQFGVPYGNGTAAVGFVSNPATAAYVFASNGTGVAPSYQTLSSLITGTNGAAVLGTTAGIRVSLATQAGLSLLGVTGAGSAIPAAIVGTVGQVPVVINATTLAFTTISVSVPTPWSGTSVTQFGVVYGMGTSQISATLAGTTAWPLVGNGTAAAPTFQVLSVLGGGSGTASLTANGVVYGNGTSAVGVTAAATSLWPLLANGTPSAPSFQLLNLTASVTGVLTVPNGGSGTSTLTSRAVLLGAGTATLQFAAPSTAGNILIDQGTAANPVFRTVSGAITMSSLGTATITGTLSIATSLVVRGTALAVATGVAVGTTTDPGDGNVNITGFYNSGGFKALATTFSMASTVFADVTGFSVNLASGVSYMFESILFATAGSTGGIQVRIAGGAGQGPAAIFAEGEIYAAGALVGQGRATTGLGTIAVATSPTTPTVRIVGFLTTNTAGTLTQQVAQVGSTTTSTVIQAGSFFRVFQVQNA